MGSFISVEDASKATEHSVTENQAQLHGQILLCRATMGDRRTSDNSRTTYPWNCILQLVFQQFHNDVWDCRAATGFLIASNIVCTAAHFLRAYEKGLDPYSKKIHIYDGNQLHDQSTSILNYRQHRFFYYSPKYKGNNQFIQHDFGIIVLNRGIYREKYLSLGINFQMKNYPATVCGFPVMDSQSQGMSLPQQKKMTGRIVQFSSDYIQYDIDTTPGQSGSPVLIEPIKGCFFVIGIHSGYYKSQIMGDKKIKGFRYNERVKNLGLLEKDKNNSACKITLDTINQIQSWIHSSSLGHPEHSKFITLDLAGINIIIPEQYYNFEVKIQQNFKQQLKSNIQNPSLKESPVGYLKKARYYFKKQNPRISLLYCQKLFSYKLPLTEVEVVELFNLFGLNYQQLNSFDIANSYYQISMNYALRIPRSKPLIYAEVCNNIGTMHLQLKDSIRANQIFQNAERILRENKSMNNQHYAAALTNLALASHDTHELKQIAINRLKNALDILHDISTPAKRYANGKLFAVKNLLGFLFQQKRYQQWIQYIINHFETIILIKIKIGVYENNPEITELRKLCKINNISNDPRSELARVEYNNPSAEVQNIKAEDININPESESENNEKEQDIKKNASDDNVDNVRQYHNNYEAFNQQSLNQFHQIFTQNHPKNQKILIWASILFGQLFKCIKSDKLTEVQSHITNFMKRFLIIR